MDTSNKSRGLYGKYTVHRVDGKDQPGGSKQDAEYFVLDYMHDPFAIEALKFYAFKCKDEYPQLSADIWMKLRNRGKLSE